MSVFCSVPGECTFYSQPFDYKQKDHTGGILLRSVRVSALIRLNRRVSIGIYGGERLANQRMLSLLLD